MASELKTSGYNIRVSKLNMASKDVIAKYGVLVSPSLVVNSVIKIVGRVPDKKKSSEFSGQLPSNKDF